MMTSALDINIQVVSPLLGVGATAADASAAGAAAVAPEAAAAGAAAAGASALASDAAAAGAADCAVAKFADTSKPSPSARDTSSFFMILSFI
jgi:hypothetical protein